MARKNIAESLSSDYRRLAPTDDDTGYSPEASAGTVEVNQHEYALLLLNAVLGRPPFTLSGLRESDPAFAGLNSGPFGRLRANITFILSKKGIDAGWERTIIDEDRWYRLVVPDEVAAREFIESELKTERGRVITEPGVLVSTTTSGIFKVRASRSPNAGLARPRAEREKRVSGLLKEAGLLGTSSVTKPSRHGRFS